MSTCGDFDLTMCQKCLLFFLNKFFFSFFLVFLFSLCLTVVFHSLVSLLTLHLFLVSKFCECTVEQ